MKDYKVFIYPYWLNYIGLNELQIKERIKNDSINIDLDVDNNLATLNIKEFIDYCNNEYNKINTNEKKL